MHITSYSAVSLTFKCLRSCTNHLQEKRSMSDFPLNISGILVGMYLTCAESYRGKLETNSVLVIDSRLVNGCEIYFYL